MDPVEHMASIQLTRVREILGASNSPYQSTVSAAHSAMNTAAGWMREAEQYREEREALLRICLHNDGRCWWAMIGVETPDGLCATEFRAAWQSFPTFDEAAKAVLEAGQVIRVE